MDKNIHAKVFGNNPANLTHVQPAQNHPIKTFKTIFKVMSPSNMQNAVLVVSRLFLKSFLRLTVLCSSLQLERFPVRLFVISQGSRMHAFVSVLYGKHMHLCIWVNQGRRLQV